LVSPVTRVVKLLTGLSEKVESEGKKEKDLYETYVCWGKSVVEQKEASNSAAESKIQELETYIADLDAGRITLTSERADLTKEIDELDHDIETTKAMREKEHHDFVVAEAEMKAAIKALDSATETLDKATKDHKGALLGVRQRLNGEERVNGGMEAFASKQASLMTAVELGRRSLTKADSLFLERALLGDVPSPDWKKLNRKATFKMSYKARSGKIQDLLKKMKVTFEENLKEAQNKEADEKEEYDKLSTAKNGQLDAARTALEEMNVENGARGLSKQDASDEVDSLKEQVEADKKIISDTESALETKKKEYSEREELRSKELQAISEAINILHSDDARDLFKKIDGIAVFLADQHVVGAEGYKRCYRHTSKRSTKVW
jgi:chromosome segregation ATPase